MKLVSPHSQRDSWWETFFTSISLGIGMRDEISWPTLIARFMVGDFHPKISFDYKTITSTTIVVNITKNTESEFKNFKMARRTGLTDDQIRQKLFDTMSDEDVSDEEYVSDDEDDIEDLLGSSDSECSDLAEEMPDEDVIPKHRIPQGPSNPVAGPSNPVAGPSNPVPASANPVQKAPGLGLVDPVLTRAVKARNVAGKRRPPRRTRRVQNIQDTLNENNYDAYEIPKYRKEFSATWKPANKPRRTDQWVNQRTEFGNDAKMHKIVRGEVGKPMGIARSAKTPLEAWELFMDTNIMTIIVQETNNSIRRARNRMSQQYLNDPRVNYIHDTDDIEIRALFGLMYLRGLMGMQNHDVKHLFSEDGHQWFGGTMSKNRFEFLLEHLSFDDLLTRKHRWKTDRFTAFRDVFEYFNSNCSRSYAPGEYLSIDECLAKSRLKIAFIQYNPRKPAKRGILFRSINDVEDPYTCSIVVMAGKPERTQDARYYTPGVVESVERLVMNLERYQQLGGRIITTDNLYTGLVMVDFFLAHHISTVGTMRINSGGVPKEFRDAKNRETNSYEVLWHKDNNDITLHSYVVTTKSKGKKNIIMLSTCKAILGAAKEDHKRPAVIEFYNFTKGGTDIMDQRMGNYTTKFISLRWTMAVLCYILDTARVNAQTIYFKNKGEDVRKSDSYQFAKDLVKELITPHVLRREERHRKRLPKPILVKMSSILGRPIKVDNEPVKREAQSTLGSVPSYAEKDEKKRCYLCKVEGKPIKNIGLIQTQCCACAKGVCKVHHHILCQPCAKSFVDGCRIKAETNEPVKE